MLMLGCMELKIRLGHVKILRSCDIGWVRFSRGGSVGVQNRAGFANPIQTCMVVCWKHGGKRCSPKFQLLRSLCWSRVPRAMLVFHLDPTGFLFDTLCSAFLRGFYSNDQYPQLMFGRLPSGCLSRSALANAQEVPGLFANDSRVLPAEHSSEAQLRLQTPLWG